MDPANEEVIEPFEDAMEVQHGGKHYKGMVIQPFEFGIANQYDPAIFSVMKYVSRHQDKGGREDLQKAHHIVGIRMVQTAKWGLPAPALNQITVDDYIEKNGIGVFESPILRDLHMWALQRYDWSDTNVAQRIQHQLQQAADLLYD